MDRSLKMILRNHACYCKPFCAALPTMYANTEPMENGAIFRMKPTYRVDWMRARSCGSMGSTTI